MVVATSTVESIKELITNPDTKNEEVQMQLEAILPDDSFVDESQRDLYINKVLALADLLFSIRSLEEAEQLERLTEHVCKQSQMNEFVDSISADTNEEEFQKHKNRLVTLITKNNNILTKYSRRKLYKNILLGLMFIMTIGFMFLYIVGSQQPAMLQTSYTVLISLSLGIVVLFVIYEIYAMFTKKTLVIEEFEDLSTCKFIGQDQSSILTSFLGTDLPGSVERAQAIVAYTSGKKSEVVQSILHDYNNMNYVNMRKYQLTDYKLQESRNKMHFIKYGFLILSIIGILGGLTLRGKDTSVRNAFSITQDMFIGGSLILIVSYLTVYLLHQKQNMIRKKYNWDKLYWNIKAITDSQDEY
jgi:hypothetical protein